MQGNFGRIIFFGIFVWAFAVSAEQPDKVAPLERGEILFEEDFSDPEIKITKPRWWTKQETRWSVEDGVLVGIPATEEYQAERREIGHHLGDVPQIGMGKMPRSYVMEFRFQMDDKPGDAKVPMFEFGHHVSRVYFGEEEAVMLTSHQTHQHTKAPDFRLKPNAWYSVVAEVGEKTLVVAITDSEGNVTRFEAHEPEFENAEKFSFGIAGTKGGTLRLDDISVWEVLDK